MIPRKRTIEDIKDYIVFSEKVAHITFHLVRMPEGYFVYSESRDRGIEQIGDDPFIGFDPMTYDTAVQILRESIQKLEQILEKKRSSVPTAKQIYYLFCHKIPISIDLTWGEASDLIDEHVNQEKQAQHQKQAERFNGFTVGQKITCQFSHPTRLESGTITKLTGNNRSGKYMYVKYDNGNTIRWPLDRLPRIVKHDE